MSAKFKLSRDVFLKTQVKCSLGENEAPGVV